MRVTTYEHPVTGQYNETIAVLADGRKVTVNTQYACVLPHGNHATDCAQLTKMGGRCECAAGHGIMEHELELVADARAHGRFGYAPIPRVEVETETEIVRGPGWCARCESYCYGDCIASARS